jgi:hypothetical protein
MLFLLTFGCKGQIKSSFLIKFCLFLIQKSKLHSNPVNEFNPLA